VRGFGKDFVLDVVQNRVLLSANYLSRYFDADGREIISKNEVCSSFVLDQFDHSIVDFC